MPAPSGFKWAIALQLAWFPALFRPRGPWHLKYAFLLAGVLLIASEVAGTYRRYKHSQNARH